MLEILLELIILLSQYGFKVMEIWKTLDIYSISILILSLYLLRFHLMISI